MRRALVAGADDARGLLAAVRSLAACGWRVGVLTPSRRSLAASSRWCAAWHPLSSDVVASVPDGYDVVLPGGDAELFALSEGRDRLPCRVPYGSRESVRRILDKVALGEAAAAAGVRVPESRAATPEALAAVPGTVVLKSRSHASVRAGTVVSADVDVLRAAADDMRAAGAEPVVQEHVAGPLLALSVVLRAGECVAAVQQRSSGLWPPEAGVSTRAETVPVDQALLAGVVALLASMGWEGLAQAQFLDSPSGPVLIDVNGRCYGSLALAAAAGVDLAAVWLGDAGGRAVPGVRYQWLYGDLRRGWREARDVLGPLAYARGAAHSVWDRRDPRPAFVYGATLARGVLTR